MTTLKQIVQPLGITKIETNAHGSSIAFTEQPNLSRSTDPTRTKAFKLIPNPPHAQPLLTILLGILTLPVIG